MFLNIFSLRKRTSFPFFLPTTLCALLALTSINIGLADTTSLLLTPTRIIFTDRQRSVDLHVSNIDQQPITYTISLVTMRKDKNGQLHEVETETAEERLTKSMIRFSPRRATIDPGKRQVVKLMVRKPQDLPPGEYQTRLSLTPQADSPQKTVSQISTTQGKAAFDINFLVRSTLPVIIQNGDIAPEVTPLSVSLQQSAKTSGDLAAEVKFNRSGIGSAFGNVRLDFIPTKNLKAAGQIGYLEGMAIYAPDTERTLIVPLKDISRQELSSGSIRVSFLPNTGSSDKQQRATQGSSKDFPVH